MIIWAGVSAKFVLQDQDILLSFSAGLLDIGERERMRHVQMRIKERERGEIQREREGGGGGQTVCLDEIAVACSRFI